MNERIEQLIKQSYVERDSGDGTWFSKEKFAELIVEECVGIVAKRKNQAIDDGWNVDEAMTMAEMDLEEHFGIE